MSNLYLILSYGKLCQCILTVICLHFIQNIDTLERVAGLPGEKIVEAHGTFHTSHCLKCKNEYSLQWMKGNCVLYNS